MSTATRDRAIQLLEFAHALVNKALTGIPDAKATFQPTPIDNNAIWTVGHLATTYAWFKSVFDGAMHPVPDTFNGLFGMGSKPSSDPKVYPPFAEVKKHADAAYAAFIAAAKKLNDAELAQPTAVETGGFCSDKMDAINKAAWHDGWHTGQLASIRKALGLPGIF